MIVLDAYAVLAFLKGETAAPEVGSLLGAQEPTALTVIGVAEVLDHLIRVVGADDEDAALDLAQLDLLNPLDLDERTAAAAGLLRARHYHRTRCAVSLADCIAAEVTRNLGSQLATSDPHLLEVCHRESIGIHSLTASNGTRWSPSG
ncbi:MAG: PIN domain-containing protein [Acidimicrobiia bacterium]|nr:PIN domain-containing protein [Acidimicrobiia bacterium]